MTVSKDEYLAAVDLLRRYREVYPDLNMVEDEVILMDVDRALSIVKTWNIQQEQKKLKSVKKSLNNSKKTVDTRPWFLKGEKSQKFFEMIILCRQEFSAYELEEISEEISKMKNSYAKKRYSAIYDYAMKQKI